MNLVSEFGRMLFSQNQLLKVCAIYGDATIIYQALDHLIYYQCSFKPHKKGVLRITHRFSYLYKAQPCYYLAPYL